ncbi:hypothetical protein DL766_004397 [Monosporascus sp. MC13-8B]|uniref:Uncharacterized protein n=1 Tax=Monosporascus cannonballus TaxID=155416 RepID=A0ABY0GZL4_9PEZI|nr:hypothetical protein DL762_007445 [Monosporascus cannonballus]RYO98724.1 hypothetical protein DL763_001985 [Monosporascus cannonballus]RYP31344.1 hypothetical protein DL766_004397 [Monosporascus sp. MC13-8B]
MDPTTSPQKDQGSLLDAAVQRMLNNQPGRQVPGYSSHEREIQDSARLENLSLASYTGDTRIIIQFPEALRSVGCNGKVWRSKEFYMSSKDLLATGSSVFAELLSPERQARTKRRLRIPSDSTALVLNLTPPLEGDELASQLVELSLPSGVKHWWTAEERLGVSRYLVSGHDDSCPQHQVVDVKCQVVPGHVPITPQEGETKGILDLADIAPSASRDIAEYCPIRHRANLIRLLLAIQGEDLVLNSAPRVYALVGIAKILDCVDVLRDSVFTWLMAQPNTEFMDINPEIALHMAWTLRIVDVTRATFRVLVAERAIEALSPQFDARAKRLTIFGRPRQELSDELKNIVEHATQSFVDRIKETHTVLWFERIFDWLGIPEWYKLRQDDHLSHGAEELQQQRTIVVSKLLQYMRMALSSAFYTNPYIQCFESVDRNRRCYIPRTKFVSTLNIHAELSPVQKLLTPVYWQDFANNVNDWANFRDFQCMALGPTSLERDVMTFNVLYASQNAGIGAPVSSDTEVDQERPTQHFYLREFHSQLCAAIRNLAGQWTAPALEVPLVRTRHINLGLSQNELKYLPLWAGGDDDGSGGVFQELPVPDCEAGSAPVGPGPLYHTGGTVASDVSSIAQSAQTLSTGDNDTNTETETLTAGRSVAAVLSASAGASTVYGDEDGESSVWTPAFTPSEGTLEGDHEGEAWSDADDEDAV